MRFSASCSQKRSGCFLCCTRKKSEDSVRAYTADPKEYAEYSTSISITLPPPSQLCCAHPSASAYELQHAKHQGLIHTVITERAEADGKSKCLRGEEDQGWKMKSRTAWKLCVVARRTYFSLTTSTRARALIVAKEKVCSHEYSCFDLPSWRVDMIRRWWNHMWFRGRDVTDNKYMRNKSMQREKSMQL